MSNELTLIDIIKRYQEGADRAVKIFQDKYPTDDISMGIREGLYKRTGNIKEEGLYFYAFHGIGLAAHFKDMIVDFDFAWLPEPRHDGFDLWRLGKFIKNQRNKYPYLLDKEKLEQEFNKLIKQGVIVNPIHRSSTALYFFKDSLPAHMVAVNQTNPEISTSLPSKHSEESINRFTRFLNFFKDNNR